MPDPTPTPPPADAEQPTEVAAAPAAPPEPESSSHEQGTEPHGSESSQDQAEGDVAAQLAEMTAQARKWEQRSKENYEAAKRVPELEAELNELRPLRDQVEALRLETLRYKTALTHSLTAEDAELFLTGTDEATLKAQAERLSSVVGRRREPTSQLQGRMGGSAPTSKAEQLLDTITSDLNKRKR